MESLRGHFLIASPHLLDPNFIRTVVLMVEHTPQGALGVVLNRPSQKTIEELWQEVGAGRCVNPRPVHLGGPVPGPLLSLHTDSQLAEMEIIPGVFISAKKAHLDKLAQRADGPMKIFLGHAGWGPGQLDNEMKSGAWLTAPANVEIIFANDHTLWEQLCRQIGREFLRATLGIQKMPDDPAVN